MSGHLAIGDGLLGKIIEDDERILALIHEPLADGAAGVGREVLIHRGIGGGGADDDRVFHRAGIFERLHDAGDVRLLLADGDVDAVKRLVPLQLPLLRPRCFAWPGK